MKERRNGLQGSAWSAWHVIRMRMLIVLAGLVAGCGGGDASNDEEDAARAVKVFFAALNENDARSACRVLTDNAQRRFVPEGADISCREFADNIQQLIIGGATTENPDVNAKVDDRAATTEVNEARGPELVKVGDKWLISRVVVIENGTVASSTPASSDANESPAGDNVAKVDSVGVITSSIFDHWFKIVAADDGSRTGRGEPPAPGTDQYDARRRQTMRFLVTAKWIEGEASRRGISATEADVMTAFRQTKDKSFRSEAAYQRFLKRSGQTQQDILYRVKLDVLSNKIRGDVLRGTSGRSGQQRIDSFSTSFRKRWKSKTRCSDDFLVSECGGAL